MTLNTVRIVNRFFNKATKSDIDNVLSEIVLSERQSKVFDMYFIKKKNVGFIADSLCISPAVIYREIYRIRSKVFELIISKENAKNMIKN